MQQQSSTEQGTANTAVPQLVDHLFRHQAGQLVSTLTRIFGFQNLELAEDIVQDTLLQALRTWPYRGIPENPAGWLMQAAKHRALDLLRRDTVYRSKQEQMARLTEYDVATIDQSEERLLDDQLSMMFTCCHPDLSREAQVALTLKTLGGLGVPEIARAFLTRESTIAQRLVRAKRTLRALEVPVEVPAADELEARLHPVLDVLYLLFNEGYSAFQGDDLIRHDLCEEALWLTSLLAGHPAGNVPVVHALLALMLLQASRIPARTDAGGDLLLLEQQDRSLWDRRLIALGMSALSRAAQSEELSVYHLQAGIAACHATAASEAATPWSVILGYYDHLIRLTPSPVVMLNRTVALAKVCGAQAGLAELDRIQHEPALAGYYLLHATYADFHRQLGDSGKAKHAYTRALALAGTSPERRFLQRRLEACSDGTT
jgi:RNA polymerase sigma factor (sigma-70 family)